MCFALTVFSRSPINFSVAETVSYYRQSLRSDNTHHYNVLVIVRIPFLCFLLLHLLLLWFILDEEREILTFRKRIPLCRPIKFIDFDFFEWMERIELHLYSLRIAVALKAMWPSIKFNERPNNTTVVDIDDATKMATNIFAPASLWISSLPLSLSIPFSGTLVFTVSLFHSPWMLSACSFCY